MKRKAILPNIITAFALSCGLFVIFKMSMLPQGAATQQNVLVAVCILILAAFLDLLDGAVARAIKAESEFGCIFDSIADAVSFGVAPAVLILKTLSVPPGTMLSFFVTMGAMIYAISGVLRLVRYAVTSHQIQGDTEKMALAKAHFTGLPIPAAASIAMSTTLFLMSDDLKSFYSISDEARAIIAGIVFFILGFFMVSRWKFPSLKSLHIRVGSFQVIFLTVFIAAIILIGVVHHFPAVFAGVSWTYFIVSLILSFVRIIAGKRIQALEDFEPDSEEES